MYFLSLTSVFRAIYERTMRYLLCKVTTKFVLRQLENILKFSVEKLTPNVSTIRKVVKHFKETKPVRLLGVNVSQESLENIAQFGIDLSNLKFRVALCSEFLQKASFYLHTYIHNWPLQAFS